METADLFKLNPLLKTGSAPRSVRFATASRASLYRCGRLSEPRARCAEMYGANGVWGAVSSALDAKGDRWIYVPLWGPPSKQVGEFKFTNGEAPSWPEKLLPLFVMGID